MKKTVTIIAIVIVTALVAGGAVYYFTSKNKSNDSTVSTNTTTTTSTKPKGGDATVQAVLAKVKAQVPTVQHTRVITEATDVNNLLGKQGEYQNAGSFYDTRTKYEPTAESDGSTDITKANYGVSAGGTVEVFANASDAKKRYEYIQDFNGSLGAPEADRLVGNVVLRVSENYTASQQKEMLDIMQSGL